VGRGRRFHRDSEPSCLAGRIRRESAPPEFRDRERRGFAQRTGGDLDRVPHPKQEQEKEQRCNCYLAYTAG
jgi:hypothetical protein